MLRVTLIQRDGQITRNQGVLTFADSDQATAYLAQAELAFGSRVVQIGQRRIVLQNRIAGLIDTSVFEGTIEEMRPLHLLCFFYQTAATTYEQIAREAAADEAVSCFGGIQRYVELATPYLIGRSRLHIAILLSHGIDEPQDLELGAHARITDLFAALELMNEEHCLFREAITL